AHGAAILGERRTTGRQCHYERRRRNCALRATPVIIEILAHQSLTPSCRALLVNVTFLSLLWQRHLKKQLAATAQPMHVDLERGDEGFPGDQPRRNIASHSRFALVSSTSSTSGPSSRVMKTKSIYSDVSPN